MSHRMQTLRIMTQLSVTLLKNRIEQIWFSYSPPLHPQDCQCLLEQLDLSHLGRMNWYTLWLLQGWRTLISQLSWRLRALPVIQRASSASTATIAVSLPSPRALRPSASLAAWLRMERWRIITCMQVLQRPLGLLPWQRYV